jgi:hypothetical protein
LPAAAAPLRFKLRWWEFPRPASDGQPLLSRPRSGLPGDRHADIPDWRVPAPAHCLSGARCWQPVRRNVGEEGSAERRPLGQPPNPQDCCPLRSCDAGRNVRLPVYAVVWGRVRLGRLLPAPVPGHERRCDQSKTSLFVISVFTEPDLMPVEALVVPYSMDCARAARPRTSAALRTASSWPSFASNSTSIVAFIFIVETRSLLPPDLTLKELQALECPS